MPSMTCVITQDEGDCSAIATLSTGHIKIKPNQAFELIGQYSACFHEEVVVVQGRYQSKVFDKGYTIELLAKKIGNLKSSDFPSTIAVITLDRASLEGVIHDVWSSIRFPSLSQEKTLIGLTCQLDDPPKAQETI